ncbi:sugar-binding domain-containing protein [Haloferula sp. A504]|uniref:sugar-binding domain-containing protein n=1 Tax=Haloferula sp. A504 TaxID=3373601 RepID=UPI0031C64025|nr:hypothetical protein [Verrucomicrobiaceae bacterium E54]
MKKHRNRSIFSALGILSLLLPLEGWARDTVDLAGEWRFQLDRGDVGGEEKWFTSRLPEKIRLPGSLQAQGYGDEPSVATKWIGSIKDRAWFESPEYEKFRQPGNIKIPCWLQPEKHYLGAAWYQRDIVLPEGWEGHHVTVSLERCHWFTDAWLGDVHLGSRESLSVPHEYVLPRDLAPGKHTLTIRVDNRIRFNVGHDAHSISDHTQTNWNGIIGDLELIARPPIWIESVRTSPGKKPDTVRVAATIRNATGKRGEIAGFQASVGGPGGAALKPALETSVMLKEESTVFEFDAFFGKAKGWDEFQPNLHRLGLLVTTGEGKDRIEDRYHATFGLREVASNGRRVTIDGRPIFLRGTLECCIFPDTGYPPTDPEPWRRIMEICREHGLNHLRFHSWCPPEVAFRVADELGFYIQAELPTWAYNMGEDQPRDEFLKRELDRILDTYGNHPSFILMSMGNELRGDDAYLTSLVDHAVEKDPRRLYACTTHHHRSASDQFRITMRIGEKRIKIRGLRGPGTDWDFSEAIVDEKIPVIAHEIGQFCAFPDFEEIKRYQGFLKPKNFELFRDRLDQRGMLPQARDFLMASGKLQALCYKEEIESMLRTPGFGGFQLLDLHDFPGQGTALVGVLNARWESKGYITPEEYRRFCAETVPLARFAKRAWTPGETFKARLDVAHFGAKDLDACHAEWTLATGDGRTVGKGRLPAADASTGRVSTLGEISAPLGELAAPTALRLTVSIPGTEAVNDWNLWVYPEVPSDEPGDEVTVVKQLDEATMAKLEAGGRVVLLPDFGTLDGRKEDWQPIFWNTQWFRTPNRSLGLLCDVDHPALAAFPTAFHSDWQWHDLVNRSVAVDLTGAPVELQPIVQVVPDWNDPRREALVFECRVGKGRLLVCSADLNADLAGRLPALQLRRSLLDYAAGDQFEPTAKVTVDGIRELLRQPPTEP